MKPKALLTTIPSDSHNWNLIFMQLFLQEKGFEVYNLGPCVPYQQLESACSDYEPDVVIVSTINGHGFIEGKELINKVKNLSSMNNKPIYMGGKLSTDVNLSVIYALELEDAGFTRVFCDDRDLGDFVDCLNVLKKNAYETYMLENLII